MNQRKKPTTSQKLTRAPHLMVKIHAISGTFEFFRVNDQTTVVPEIVNKTAEGGIAHYTRVDSSVQP
jgi:hypothetical protein